MSNYKVGYSPLTSEIYAGSVSKNGLWGKKHLVTDTAIRSVAEFLLDKNITITFSAKGKQYSMKVEELKSEQDVNTEKEKRD